MRRSANKRRRDRINVILSEAKDLTVGIHVYCNQLKINEGKMIQGSLKILPSDGRSLAALGMTE
jgi:hypothetical protein